MVELTKYAMDAMGVTGNGRVTFSQITRYREQLQQEFNAALKNGIENSGISDPNKLGFELDMNGKIAVTGTNQADRKTAQAWFDANPSFGKDLLAKLPEDAFENSTPISFTIASTGALTVINENHEYLHKTLREKGDLAANARDRLERAGMDINYPFDLVFDAEGNLVIKDDHPQATELNAFFKENPELADGIKKELDKAKVHPSAVTVHLGSTGAPTLAINDAKTNSIQAALSAASDTGAKIYSGLNNLGIDKNISFNIQVESDGTLKVVSDHPDAAKIQQLFNDNPELVKKYRQIETLAGIDDAREAMQISPSAMRKRIQIESMASWWAGSSDAASYFGNYNANGLSLLSGLNITA